MGHCDTFDSHALRCRPQQKAWVWRRAYFTALFRYFTLNTWSAAYLYLGKAKGEQKDFLATFRDTLLRGRKEKQQRKRQEAEQEYKQAKSAYNRARYQKQKVAKSRAMMTTFRAKPSPESEWTPPAATAVSFRNCLGKFRLE